MQCPTALNSAAGGGERASGSVTARTLGVSPHHTTRLHHTHPHSRSALECHFGGVASNRTHAQWFRCLPQTSRAHFLRRQRTGINSAGRQTMAGRGKRTIQSTIRTPARPCPSSHSHRGTITASRLRIPGANPRTKLRAASTFRLHPRLHRRHQKRLAFGGDHQRQPKDMARIQPRDRSRATMGRYRHLGLSTRCSRE
jgi:hypothetical protein